MRFFFLLSFKFWFFIGCVTIAPMNSEDADKLKNKWGSDCLNLEGGSQLIFQNGEKRVSLTLDWLTDRQGVLTTEFSDALGRPLGTIIFDKDDVSKVRDNLFKSYPFSLGEKGYFWVGGFNTHIKSFELGCLFGGKLPVSWLFDLKGADLNWTSQTRDEVRIIDLEGGLDQVCGSVGSADFWRFMGSKLSLCVRGNAGKLSYGADYFFEWSALDGENP